MLDVLLRLTLFLSAGFLIWLAFTTWRTIRWLTHPPRRGVACAISRSRPSTPDELAPPRTGEEWFIVNKTHNIHCWYITGDAPSAPTLILSHGWGDSRITMLDRLPHLLPHFRRIILWDMPGHGEAPGICTLGTREHRYVLRGEMISDAAGRFLGVSMGCTGDAGCAIVFECTEGELP